MTETLKKDIRAFVEQQQTLLLNERDFQMQLAKFLDRTGNYDEVLLEYHIPNDVAKGYDWDSNLYIDIVVGKSGVYYPIELKYLTKSVVRTTVRFGEELSGFELLREQGAQNMHRYDIWKDVRRCEILKKRFSAVKGGLAVVLTNDASYLSPVKSTSACYPFRTSEGETIGPGEMDWNGTPALAKSRKKFCLDGRYTFNWNKTQIDKEDFYYQITEV